MPQLKIVQIFSVLLSVTLLVQLSTIAISFDIPSQSYGSAAVVSSTSKFNALTIPAKENTLLSVGGGTQDSIVFVGDILLARNVEELLRRNGATYPYDGLKFSSIAYSSHIVGNFEAAVPVVHEPTVAGSLQFSVDTFFLSNLRRAGFTHLSLANNHSLDYGERNFFHTKESLSANDFTPMGHPLRVDKDSVSFLTVNGVVMALLNVHTLVQTPTASEIEAVLSYAKARSDMQIVYVHWGTEYELVNDASQRRFAELLVKFGVDLVIGHHPHVVQNIDVIDGVPVLYSLGNYIFDQYFSQETQEGLVVHLDVTNEPTLYLYPVTSEASLSQPREMNPLRHMHFLRSLADRSSPAMAPFIRQGYIPLDSLVASSSKIAMIVR